MRSYSVKENHIGLAVSEIFRYRQKKLTTLYNRINYYFSDCKNDEKSERLRFNSTTSCPYPLVRTQVKYIFSSALKPINIR